MTTRNGSESFKVVIGAILKNSRHPETGRPLIHWWEVTAVFLTPTTQRMKYRLLRMEEWHSFGN